MPDTLAAVAAILAITACGRTPVRIRYPDTYDGLGAALQWASASDVPIWLRIQTNAGHAGVDQVKQKIEQNADTCAFLMWQLGMN